MHFNDYSRKQTFANLGKQAAWPNEASHINVTDVMDKINNTSMTDQNRKMIWDAYLDHLYKNRSYFGGSQDMINFETAAKLPGKAQTYLNQTFLENFNHPDLDQTANKFGVVPSGNRFRTDGHTTHYEPGSSFGEPKKVITSNSPAGQSLPPEQYSPLRSPYTTAGEPKAPQARFAVKGWHEEAAPQKPPVLQVVAKDLEQRFPTVTGRQAAGAGLMRRAGVADSVAFEKLPLDVQQRHADSFRQELNKPPVASTPKPQPAAPAKALPIQYASQIAPASMRGQGTTGGSSSYNYIPPSTRSPLAPSLLTEMSQPGYQAQSVRQQPPQRMAVGGTHTPAPLPNPATAPPAPAPAPAPAPKPYTPPMPVKDRAPIINSSQIKAKYGYK